MGANFLFSSFPAHYDSEKTNKLIIFGVPVNAVNKNNVIPVAESIYQTLTSILHVRIITQARNLSFPLFFVSSHSLFLTTNIHRVRLLSIRKVL